MQDRSRGVTALAFSSILIGLYCQFAAFALILTGSVFSPSGSTYAGLAMLVGVFFFVLTFASYFLAYGYWTHKSWAWVGGVALFVALVVASAALSIIATNFTSTVLPLAGAVVGIWYLNRPAVKAELLGTEASVPAPATRPAALDAPEPVS